MIDNIQRNLYRSILCLNGILPEKSFFTDLNLPIIAADGAANHLHALGIAPNIIIGDLDSAQPTIHSQHETLHLPEQDTCDYQKSLAYLQHHDLLPAIVVGINGGYLDHILNNINIFLETNSLLYAPPLIGYALNAPTEQEFLLPTNSKISLLGIPSAIISSQGLQWELNNQELTFPGKTSCFNKTIQESIKIMLHQGRILILIYLE